MDTEAAVRPVLEVVVRPVRDVDAESLGRVHARCWHETYDHLISQAALERLSPMRMAELWTRWMSQGDEYTQFAAIADGEVIGFSGSGPARDTDPPRERELYFIYLLAEFQGTGTGQKLLNAAIGDGSAYLWVASDNPRARSFYRRNGFAPDGEAHSEPFLGEAIQEVRLVR